MKRAHQALTLRLKGQGDRVIGMRRLQCMLLLVDRTAEFF